MRTLLLQIVIIYSDIFNSYISHDAKILKCYNKVLLYFTNTKILLLLKILQCTFQNILELVLIRFLLRPLLRTLIKMIITNDLLGERNIFWFTVQFSDLGHDAVTQYYKVSGNES